MTAACGGDPGPPSLPPSLPPPPAPARASLALDDPEEICRVASLLVQLLMPLLAGAALGGDQTETKQKNSEKSSQPIREPVGASRNLLAVKTATTTCIKAFFFFFATFVCLFSLLLRPSFT